MTMSRFCLFLFTIVSFGVLSQERDPYLKKLGVYDQTRRTLKDSVLVRKINTISKDSSYTNALKAQLYAREAIKMAQNIEDYKGQVTGYLNLGKAKIHLNEFDSALVYADKALAISKKYHFALLEVNSIDLRGSVYSYMGDYEKASKEFFLVISKAEKIHERHSVKGYANMGHVFLMLTNNKKCRIYSEKGLKLAEKHKDTAVMVTTLNLLGLVEKREKNLDVALVHFERGLKLARATNSIQRQSQLLYNMSNIYFDKMEHDKGFALFNESLELGKKNGSFLSTAINFHSLSIHYSEINRYRESNIAADSAIHYGLKSKNFEMIMEAYAMKAEILKLMNRHKEALGYLGLAYAYKDSLKLGQLNDAALESESEYKKGKKEMADSLKQFQADAKRERDKRIADEQVKSRETLIWVFAFVLVLVVIGLYYLQRKNQVVKKQNAEIQTQHKEITDSILYAERIQEAIMSKQGEWEKISNEHFVLFKPKDVVSGDFYWAYNNSEKNLSIWAVSDCTGHGVPGAFMSMLGTGLLNEIVIENGTIDPGTILDKLRSKIVTALTQKGEAKTNDGMDISICVWDKTAKKLRYAGANNPLWIVRHKDGTQPEGVSKSITSKTSALCLLEIAPDKMPVGFQSTTPRPFTTHEVDVLPGDFYALITDGFADQFGGEKGKKFKSLPLKQLLLDIQEETSAEQRAILDSTFEQWKGSEEQVDDVCIVGVKVTA